MRLVASLLLATSLACAGARTPEVRADPTPSAEALLLNEIDGLELSFVDPETFEAVRAGGPFTLLSVGPEGVELEGIDHAYQKARVRLFVRDGHVWARAVVQGRQFLTVLH